MRLFLCFLTIMTGCSDALEYVPPLRIVNVIEGGKYSIGLKETSPAENITKCFYSSDTGISGSFDVIKPEPPETGTDVALTKRNRVENNRVGNYGKIGRCEIYVEFVDENGPNSWTMTAVLNATAQIPAVTFTVNFFYKIPLLLEAVTVQETLGFFQYLNADRNFLRCTLQFNNVEIELSVDSGPSNIYLSPYSRADEDVSKRIRSIGLGLCGFHLRDAAVSDSIEWTLTGTDAQDKKSRAVFKSTVFPKKDESAFLKEVEASLGESQWIQCGIETTDQDFCLLYNPDGKLVQNQRTCSVSLTSTSLSDIGTWKCLTGVRNHIETVDYTVQLSHREVERIERWVNETEGYLRIGCRITNYKYASISYCRMRAPNNSTYNLVPGSATDRYIPVGTDFKNMTCTMQIMKPLQDHERGTWRCEIGVSSNQIAGAFLQVGQANVPGYPRYSRITAQLHKRLVIECDVPYSSDYCHIKAPNGTIFPTKDAYASTLGKCSFEIEATTASDNGTWRCSYAREMGVADEEIYVEVTIAEVLSYYKSIEADIGDKVQLLCSTNGLPLNYCRFLAPNGHTYHIHNHQSSEYITYYGKGLEYGDCGITINEVKVSDQGTWRCLTRIGSRLSQQEISAEITLDITPNLLDDPNVAAAVGISVGVIIVTTMLGFVAFRKWKRRRHAAIDGTSTAQRPINDDNGSENDIFNIGNLPQSYSNPVRDDHEHQM